MRSEMGPVSFVPSTWGLPVFVLAWLFFTLKQLERRHDAAGQAKPASVTASNFNLYSTRENYSTVIFSGKRILYVFRGFRRISQHWL
jgi:hypothetical protein